MVNVNRVRVAWTGFVGAPGVSTFYSTGSIAASRLAIYNLFNAIKSTIPGLVDLTVETSGEIFDPVSGDLVTLWADSTPYVITATGTGTYSAPTGYAINWFTGSVFNGHVLRGRTYIVPASNTCYQTDGTILDSLLTTLRAAADAYVTETAGAAVIWSRPKPGVSGGFSAINDGDVSDKAAVLRSRRD